MTFKTEKEQLKFEKEHFLTVGKLKDFLNKLPDDMLIYSIENNTGTWQNIPEIRYLMRTYEEEYDFTKQWLNNWYAKSENTEEKVNQELNDMFKYVIDKNALYIQN